MPKTPCSLIGLRAAISRYSPLTAVVTAMALSVHSSISLANESRVVSSTNAPAAIGPYSQAIKAGSMLYLSGQLPIEPATNFFAPDTPIETQTRQVLENIKAVLTADGLQMSDVVSITVYLKDLNDFARMNVVYATYFSDSPPARVTVQIGRLPMGAAIEISAIAQRR